MANFSDFSRKISAAVGALVVSMVFITAAVGPAATASSGAAYAAAQSQASVQDQQA